MISITGVSKKFGGRAALENLSIEVPKGGIYGLLGHNGAGKSTTIGILLGQVFPDSGEARINGANVFQERHRALAHVGAIFEAPAFYPYLSGERNLKLFCAYTAPVSRERMTEVIKLVGLEKRIRDRAGTYSHGMRQRLALAQALLPQPELLILDEPSEGLDPEGIHEMRLLIQKLNREWGLTILFSSHLLSEVQQLCTQLAVLKQGKLLFAGNWREFSADQRWVKVTVDRQAEAEAGLKQAQLMEAFEFDGRGLLSAAASVPQVARWLVSNGYQVQAIHAIERTLEDFYLQTVHEVRA